MTNPLVAMQSIIKIIIVLCVLLSACKNEEGPTVTQPTPVEEPTHPNWITMDYVMGKFDPAEHPDFVKIEKRYADRTGRYMRKEAYADFIKMYEAAAKENIQLTIKSAARNFNYQKGIWERKWNGETILEGGINATTITDEIERAKKILLYSSMPGTSRHHWGTDIDLNSFTNSYFESGDGLKLYNWLLDNASKYGYCQVYTDKSSGRTGYEEEKWHWSYLPLAKDLTIYSKENFRNESLSGFQGSETAVPIDMKTNYILGINSACL